MDETEFLFVVRLTGLIGHGFDLQRPLLSHLCRDVPDDYSDLTTFSPMLLRRPPPATVEEDVSSRHPRTLAVAVLRNTGEHLDAERGVPSR
jgi:hypothetical protein